MFVCVPQAEGGSRGHSPERKTNTQVSEKGEHISYESYRTAVIIPMKDI